MDINLGTSYYVNAVTRYSSNNTAAPEKISATSYNTPSLNISSEAREKLKEEQASLEKKAVEGLLQQSTEETKSTAKSDAEIDKLDELIEQLQERIKEVQRKLAKIRSDNSEEAERERRMLEGELISLNASLINILGKKMDALAAG
ncbi:hypothetical protein ACFSJY_12700 [Thalassotalea euphylliae]|uniref:hypothetical protein n=1 Tax=Thalassotalea euphylliae TaxID=1655234 RepID=UPI00362FE327